MKTKLNSGVLVWSLFVAGIFSGAPGWTQQNGVKHASDFTSVEYYEAPNPQQIKTRLSGAEASPLAGGLLVIKKLKLETFAVDGKPEYIAEAPECVYDQFKGIASSPGWLKIQRGNGNLRVEGEGFLWRRDDQFLTLSNNVHTVMESAAASPWK